MRRKLFKAGTKWGGVDFYITEHSWIAGIATYFLKSNRMAIVIGTNIHLYNVSAQEFLKDEKWLRHEMCHLSQYRKYGKLVFIVKYLIESIRNGYYNNTFEKEARSQEVITQ